MKRISTQRCFDGQLEVWQHHSACLNCEMCFSLFLPPQLVKQKKVPLLYWLSGLTCTEANFMQKAGALRIAAQLGITIVAPDTSPRGSAVPDDPEGAYDLGLGAGFYVNATQKPWSQHYQMYDYVQQELPQLIESHFPVNEKRSIAGHSMGGHGALVMALSTPERYCSVSAFSPICHPIDCSWGQKTFRNYLGDDIEQWRQYDAVELMQRSNESIPMLVDQGDDDEFIQSQLRPACLQLAAEQNSYALNLRHHPGYDHSYYFIASFIEDHLRFHANHLRSS